MSPDPVTDVVDARMPAWQLVLFGLQHVLSMAASPITAVFLVARMLSLPADLTVQLIGATFFACGIGTLLQSFGWASIGARLLFVMVPGGAPVMLFAVLAKQTDLPTAAGAAILTSLFYWIILPMFARCLRFFPRVVIGVMLLLVSVSLIRIYAGVIVGQPGTPNFARPQSLGLTLLTIVATLVIACAFKGTAGRLAVLLGLVIGALSSWAMGFMPLATVMQIPILIPNVYARFPANLQLVLGNGMAAGTIAAIIVNLAFTAAWSRSRKKIQTT